MILAWASPFKLNVQCLVDYQYVYSIKESE